MLKISTGAYETTAFKDAEVRSFVPDTLPPKRSLNIQQMQKLLDSALLALGKLEATKALFPDPLLYLPMIIRTESVHSSQIDGIKSNLKDVLLFELEQVRPSPVDDDMVEVINYVNAMNHGLKRVRDGNHALDNRLIKELHEILLHSFRGYKATPGEFRITQNWIGGSRPEHARFVPPPMHKVEDCMVELERFIHSNSSKYSGLINAGLTHVQFETIHPFLDGNGRIGRLLIALQLKSEGMLSQPVLPISQYFDQHRDDYYRLLNDVRTEGRWEDWLEFFLSAVLEASTDALSVAQGLAQLFRADENKALQLNGNRMSALKILQAFQRRPIMPLKMVADLTGLTFPTVASGVQALEDLEILVEITGKRRNRIYLYSEHLSLFEINA